MIALKLSVEHPPPAAPPGSHSPVDGSSSRNGKPTENAIKTVRLAPTDTVHVNVLVMHVNDSHCS